MHTISNKIYMVIGLALISAAVYFSLTGAIEEPVVYPFYDETYQPNLAAIASDRNYTFENSRAVTADDYQTITRYEMISVELTVVTVELDHIIEYPQGITVAEYYSLIGEDSTGAPWCATITRNRISEPDPTTQYTEGQSVTVYGGLWGDTFSDAAGMRVPEIGVKFIVD